MGDTSRNAPQSFEEMAEESTTIEYKVDGMTIGSTKPTKSKKLNWFQSILAWWGK
jgi:hypothetical protein